MSHEKVFSVGDNVRYLINKKLFEKGSTPRWSKTVCTIKSKQGHSYTLNNNKVCKYYELQAVPIVEKLESIVTRAKSKEPSIEQVRKQNTIKRRLKKEDIDLSNILTSSR